MEMEIDPTDCVLTNGPLQPGTEVIRIGYKFNFNFAQPGRPSFRVTTIHSKIVVDDWAKLPTPEGRSPKGYLAATLELIKTSTRDEFSPIGAEQVVKTLARDKGRCGFRVFNGGSTDLARDINTALTEARPIEPLSDEEVAAISAATQSLVDGADLKAPDGFLYLP